MLNRKLTKDTLKSTYTTIELVENDNHIQVKIDHHKHTRLKGVFKTCITSDLNVFERKVVLLHVYKLLEECGGSKLRLKKILRYTNYSGVFGSPWG